MRWPSLPIKQTLTSASLRGTLALFAITLLNGCSWLGLDGKQSTITVEGPVARTQLSLFYISCWVSLVIFLIVGTVLAYTMIRFRNKSEADEHAEPPPQSHGNPLIEVGLISAAILALAVIAVPTVKAIFYTYDVPAEMKGDAFEVNATGYQWWFRFEYPSEQIAGHGNLATANELVIPAGRPVHVNLRSMDVMHSFWVPKLAGKVDMIPNRANFLWLEAEHPGYYWGQCAEFCGESHAVMRFRVIALGPREFNQWLENQEKPARDAVASARAASSTGAAPLRAFAQNESGATGAFEGSPLDAWRARQAPDKDEDPALIARGRELFSAKTCSTCHTVRGNPLAVGVVGPELTHVGARSTIAAGLLDNTPEQLRRWIHNPEAVKPGNKMWAAGYVPNHITLSAADEVALVAYLESLK
jgi:cytochrome c oxidase subunit II